MMKKAFTLIEVNLAMLIMAGGILSVVGLYAFGFRENRQSREDVAATTLADGVISPLVMAISSTNIPWSTFRAKFNEPEESGEKTAWACYVNDRGVVTEDPHGKAEGVFGATLSRFGRSGVTANFPSKSDAGMSCGLVVQHDEDSAVYRISFRATRLPGELLAMPLFYTEVRFQGLPDE